MKGPQVALGYLSQPDLQEGFSKLGDAVRLADPEDPERGMVLDGRLAENFKLASGAFVSAGPLRVARFRRSGRAATDAVVCGEGDGQVGLMFYPDPTLPTPEVETAVRTALPRFNDISTGGSMRVGRALVLESDPDAASDEIIDKGYIAQSLARTRRAEALQRLFANPPTPDVMVLT